MKRSLVPVNILLFSLSFTVRGQYQTTNENIQKGYYQIPVFACDYPDPGILKDGSYVVLSDDGIERKKNENLKEKTGLQHNTFEGFMALGTGLCSIGEGKVSFMNFKYRGEV